MLTSVLRLSPIFGSSFAKWLRHEASLAPADGSHPRLRTSAACAGLPEGRLAPEERFFPVSPEELGEEREEGFVIAFGGQGKPAEGFFHEKASIILHLYHLFQE